MEMHQVRYFLALCEERSFTRAANRCRVRQPSLTNGIKALELALGGELFLRTKPVQLSAFGRKVLPCLQAIEASVKEAQRISASHLSRAPAERAMLHSAPSLVHETNEPLTPSNGFGGT